MVDPATLEAARRALRDAADAWHDARRRGDAGGAFAAIALHDAARMLSPARIDVMRAARAVACLLAADPPREVVPTLEAARTAIAAVQLQSLTPTSVRRPPPRS